MRPVTPVLVVVAAALALAGCSDPEPGSPLPTSASSVSTEASSSAPPSTGSAPPAPTTPTASKTSAATPEPSATPVTAPTLPPEATTNDAAGAEAFVRYWYAALNYAYATGDAEPLAAVSLEECEVCASYVDEFAALRQTDQLEGGQVELLNVTAPPLDSTGNVLVALLTEQSPSRVIDKNGQVVGEASGESISLNAVLSRTDGGWGMYGLGA